MIFNQKRSCLIATMSIVLSGCAGNSVSQSASAPLRLELTRLAASQLGATYRAQRPIMALHFEQELGGYRAQRWQPLDSGFRWVTEGEGERIERVNGQSFDRLSFTIPIDYRPLPKGYAPFSPFSDGSALIHSGQFHACLTAPCEEPGPLPISIEAQGQTVGINGRRLREQGQFVSRDAGTNIFVGWLEPITADGFVAVVDPGLPGEIRRHLDRSLPQAMDSFSAVHGPLTFTPELYVSIDETPEAEGRISTQGGTLPNQVFMHFDGEDASEGLAAGSPFWLDWFFAHEAAHLFQQDKTNGRSGSDQEPWLHEGGADAMAALALVARSEAEQDYARGREQEAETACARGLALYPLSRASAEGDFDLHYQCGLLIWLALDHDLRRAGVDGLHALNLAFFARVRSGQPWNETTALETARELGASEPLLAGIGALTGGRYSEPTAAVEQIGVRARLALDGGHASD